MWIRIMAEYQVHRVSQPLVRRTVRANSLGSDYNKKFEYQKVVTKKAIENYPELTDYETKRMSYLLSNRATYNLSKGNTSEARTDALASIKTKPILLRPYLILGLSIMPAELGKKMFRRLKRIKNK
jgi:hypothetical protein